MIPKYFRCGDPSQRCRLSVSKDIVKEQPEWICPCDNPNCSDFREPVPLITGITGGKPWIVYGGASALIVLVLLIVLLDGGDPFVNKLKELKARHASLESKVRELELRVASAAPNQPVSVRVSNVKENVSELQGKATAALLEKDGTKAAGVLSEIEETSRKLKSIVESIDNSDSGSGVTGAEAISVIDKLQKLESEAEQSRELAYVKSPHSIPIFDELLLDIDSTLNRARKLAAGGISTASSEDVEPKKALAECLTTLEKVKASLNAFLVHTTIPFQPEEADFIVAATSDLADKLVNPLVEAWSETPAVKGTNGEFFYDSRTAGKILVKPLPAKIGFDQLVKGRISILISDRYPNDFGYSLRSTRSIAEVVALDALTFLVHPDNPLDTFEIGATTHLRLGVGIDGSPVHTRAKFYGLDTHKTSDLSGEEAALTDKNLVALSRYHEEASNLRAKRLAVKASPEALALKPSPFTIATEDYRFSFRIVAWITTNPTPEALSFIKFCTSNDGQIIVANQGFVDLRLRPGQSDVAPEILAALGEALGVARLSSAIRLSTNFRFDVGESNLDIKALADLERLPRYLANNYPDHKVVILGFTDSDGGLEINMPLSKDRAEVVARELRRSKVDTRTTGLGPAFPIDTNKTEDGKAKNRRAEVWVVKP